MYNILICDDEKDIVSALSIYLSTENYKIFTALQSRRPKKVSCFFAPKIEYGTLRHLLFSL